VAAFVAVVAAVSPVERILVAVVVKVDITDVATATIFTVEIAAAVAGVSERFAAAAIVVVLDRYATSAFSESSIQKLFASVRTARNTWPRTLARYGIVRVLWMARTRGRNQFVSR
jgi:thymidylate kinase